MHCAQIFIVSSEKIRLRGYETLYTYSTSNPKSALARFVASVAPQWQARLCLWCTSARAVRLTRQLAASAAANLACVGLRRACSMPLATGPAAQQRALAGLTVRRPAQPLVYMSLHIFLTTATFIVAKIFWNFYYAHTAFLVIILGMSAWNGASYYFEVRTGPAPRQGQPLGLEQAAACSGSWAQARQSLTPHQEEQQQQQRQPPHPPACTCWTVQVPRPGAARAAALSWGAARRYSLTGMQQAWTPWSRCFLADSPWRTRSCSLQPAATQTVPIPVRTEQPAHAGVPAGHADDAPLCALSSQPVQEQAPGSPLGKDSGGPQQNGNTSPQRPHSPLRPSTMPEGGEAEEAGGLPSAEQLALDTGPLKKGR